MTLLLAAVGATVMALLELTIGQYLRIGVAQPHLVLVLGIVVTVTIGVETGLVWAFVGGLILDVLAQRPLGSTAFALVIVVGATALILRMFIRLRPIVPILATLSLSLPYSMTLFIAYTALRGPASLGDPVSTLLPGVGYDVAVATLVGPLLVSVHDRRIETERIDW